MCAEEGKPPADLSLLLVLNPVIYSAPLPPPAARGSCSNYCSSGDTDGNVSLSGKKKKTTNPACLFSCGNVYHKIHLYFIFTQKCNKTPRGEKKSHLHNQSSLHFFASLKQILQLSHSPQEIMSLERVALLKLMVVNAININYSLSVQLGVVKSQRFF